MNKTIIKSILAILFVGALILPAACQPGSASSSSAPPRPGPRLNILRAVPAGDNTTRTAYVQDHALLAAKQEQFSAVSVVPHGMSIMQNNRFWNLRYYNDAEWQKNMGFTRADMEQEAFDSGPAPMDQYQVIRGRFDRSKIEAALRSDPTNLDLSTVTYAGMSFYRAGKDGINLDRRNNIRPLGQGLRLAVANDLIFYTSFTRTMQQMIDAYNGSVQSLASLESYQRLSEGLDRLDAFAAILSTESQAQSHVKEVLRQIIDNPGSDEGSAARRTMAEQLQREVLLKPYQAFATGMGLDEKGYYMAIVLVNADGQTARGNAGLLGKQLEQSKLSFGGQRWSDLIDDMQITSTGRLTLAKLHGHAGFYWKAFDIASGIYEPLLMYRG